MSGRARIRSLGAVAVALGAAALAAPAAALTPALPEPTIVEGPAFVTITLPVSGGTLVADERDVEARDPQPADGAASVLVTSDDSRVQTRELQRAGVRVRTSVVTGGRSLIELTAARRRFAFLSYDAVAGGRRLRVRLWRSAPIFRGATRRDDGCLRITRYAGTTGRVSARGLELVPLFEHGLVLQLRDAGGRSVGLRPITAREGRFRPDFSGYLTPGTWSGTVPHRVTRRQRGALQVWVTSARDGALTCLVQVPVMLAPRAG